jgi:hypothetical protein
MQHKKGHLKLSRGITEHWVWKRADYFQAWTWLLLNARYAEGEKTDLIDNKLVTWKRGELIASIRFLQQNWRWKSKTSVENFLKKLEKDKMIVRNSGQGIGHLTICNYESYNDSKDSKKDSRGTAQGQQRDSTRTEEGQDSKKGKERKKERKEEGEVKSPSISNCFEHSEKVGNEQAINLAATQFKKLHELKIVALLEWLQYLNAKKMQRLTTFEIQKLIQQFQKYPDGEIPILISQMISEGQRGIYFDRLDKKLKNAERNNSNRKGHQFDASQTRTDFERFG